MAVVAIGVVVVVVSLPGCPMPMGRMVDHQHLALRACPRLRAQHGGGNRAPDGEQHRKNHQKPDAKEFHCTKGINKPATLVAGATSLSRCWTLPPWQGQAGTAEDRMAPSAPRIGA